ncbi:MAG: putative diguanylate cyclase YdaM [Planctomycetota bacterium]
MQSTPLERVLSSPNLPTLPAVAMRVLELTAKPDVSLREIASVIEHDPAIATKVLRTVNSSYYGLTRRCGSIQQALAFLGMQTVKALVLGFSLARSIDGGGDDEVSFDFLSYWRRSIYAAAAAREIAIATRRTDPDEAFIAALLAEVGTVALWRAYGDRYLQTIDLARGDHRRLGAHEDRAFGTSHADVGAEMLVRWRLPDEIAEAVRTHHRSHEAAPDAAMLARTVELAGTAASVLSMRDATAELVRYRRDGQDWFAIRPAPLTNLLQRIADKADELSRAFGLDTGAAPDVDGLLRAAAELRESQHLVDPEATIARSETVPSAGLAGTPDARAFGTDLEQEFLDRAEGGAPRHAGVGAMLVGVDRARSIQEAFGQRGVEAAMEAVAAAVRTAMPRSSTLYRFVGAELAILARETDAEEMCRFAETVRRAVTERLVENGAGSGGFPVTVSVGVAIYETAPELRATNGIETPDQLVSAAMYALACGRRHRNRVVVFRRELRAEQGAV